MHERHPVPCFTFRVGTMIYVPPPYIPCSIKPRGFDIEGAPVLSRYDGTIGAKPENMNHDLAKLLSDRVLAFDTITGVLGGKTLTSEHVLKKTRIEIVSYYGYYSRGEISGKRITATSYIDLEILAKERPTGLEIASDKIVYDVDKDFCLIHPMQCEGVR